MKKIIFLLVLFIPCRVFCSDENLDVIDTPTAQTIDYGGFNTNFRFYANGGVLSRIAFGVRGNVNIGLYLDTDKIVGSQAADLHEPGLVLKIRLYDGSLFLPAIALGYDTQGYRFDQTDEQYRHREKGLFLAVTQELIPLVEASAGANIYNFKTDDVYGFVNVNINLLDFFSILAEYDNIHNRQANRLNAGLRYYVLKDKRLSVEIDGRDLGRSGDNWERIIRINFIGLF